MESSKLKTDSYSDICWQHYVLIYICIGSIQGKIYSHYFHGSSENWRENENLSHLVICVMVD